MYYRKRTETEQQNISSLLLGNRYNRESRQTGSGGDRRSPLRNTTLQRNIPPPTWTGTTKSSRSSVEMADALSRPALRSQPKNLAAYDTIYIGFPIWWNLAPRIINSFIEKGDFTGKILIPFATSGGSRISNAEQELKKAYPNLNWQKGRLMNGATKEEIKQWTKNK
mgnify:CR=1 FL=1